MKTTRPIGMLVYLPVTLHGKEVKTVSSDKLDYFRVEVGDSFSFEKRKPGVTLEAYKCTSVTFNVFDRTCIVELEPKDFKTKSDLDTFLNGKKRV